MLAVSAKWLPALTTDHGLSVKVNVLYDGAVVAEDIDFADGSITVDRGSETRRALSLTIADPSEFPISATDKFSVYGQQLYVEGGITYLDGSTERVPLGLFVITNVSGNIHTGPLNISGAGLELILKRALWDNATSTATFATVASFISYHVTDTIPSATFVDRSTRGGEAIATKTWDAQNDKWSALDEAAKAVGAELFCDANGTFVLDDIPDPDDANAPVAWDVDTGENGVMVSADMTLTAEAVYNRVVVTGENAEDGAPPVVGEAKITATSDPLYYGGPFGKVSKSYSSSLITTSAMAIGTAAALLRKYRSPNRTVSLETVPNMALDAGDRIRVNYGEAHTPEIHIVNNFSIPLSVTGESFAIETVSGKDDE